MNFEQAKDILLSPYAPFNSVAKAPWETLKPLNMPLLVGKNAEVLFHDNMPVAIILNRFVHEESNAKYKKFIIDALVKHGGTEVIQSEYETLQAEFNARFKK
jgi:hypothetical protein